MRRLLPIIALLAMGTAPPPSPPASAADVIARMEAQRANLNSYQVRVGFDIDLRAFLRLHFTPQATYYFKRPDKNALVFDSLPPAAQTFQHFYGSIGTPETWQRDYDVTLLGATHAGTDPSYLLKLVPKAGDSLDHVLLTVDATDYGVAREVWYYKSGATITMDQANERVGGYLLPKTQTAAFNFPSYKAQATSTFDGYHVNVSIPDSVFSGN